MFPRTTLSLLAAIVVLVGSSAAYGQIAARGGQSAGVRGGGQAAGKAGQARSGGQPSQARGGKSAANTGQGGVRQNAASGKQHTSVQKGATPRAKSATTSAKDSAGKTTTNAGNKAATTTGRSKQAVDSGNAIAPNAGGTVNRKNTAAYGRGYGRSRSHRGYHPYSYPPSGTPALAVDSGQPLTHVLTFGGKQHRGHGAALPHGVTGIEIWGKVGGPAPADPSELTRGAVANGNSYTVSFDANQAGTTVYYSVRYVNSQGAGAFSKIVNATVRR